MATGTVTQEEFSRKKGERYETKKPKDSDILKGDGSFAEQTEKETEFTQKMGERYETVKPGTSDIWKVADLFMSFEGSLLLFQ